MAHIILIGWKERMTGLSDKATIIHEAIENEEYEGQQLTDAQALMTRCDTLETDLDPQAKPAGDLLTDMESFLA